MNTNFDENNYGSDYRNHILEQYKLYIEMADRISQRRINTNTFFISANTFLIAIISMFGNSGSIFDIIVCFLGVAFAATWLLLLNSYKRINSAKFEIVHEIEALLPISPYDAEWVKVGQGKDKKLYWPVSHLEIIMPIAFMLLHIALFIYLLTCSPAIIPVSS